jgi:hypothetical protein
VLLPAGEIILAQAVYPSLSDIRYSNPKTAKLIPAQMDVHAGVALFLVIAGYNYGLIDNILSKLTGNPVIQ